MANSTSSAAVDVILTQFAAALAECRRHMTTMNVVVVATSTKQRRKSTSNRMRHEEEDGDDEDDDDDNDRIDDHRHITELRRVLDLINALDSATLTDSATALVAHFATALQLPAPMLSASSALSVCASVLLKLRPGAAVAAEALNALVPPLLSLAVTSPRDSAVQLDAFRALAALVLERGALILPRLHDALVVSLLALVDDSKRPSPELLRLSFNTLGNLCIGAAAAIAAPLYASLTAAFAVHLDGGVRSFFAGKRTAARSLCAVLRAWTLVLPECGTAHERYLANCHRWLHCLRSCMCHHLWRRRRCHLAVNRRVRQRPTCASVP
jgi:hypothetical protein